MSAAVAGLRSIRPTRSYTNRRDVTRVGCGSVKVQGVHTAISLDLIRFPPMLSCRKARAVTRYAWNPANRKPGDPTVLADLGGWKCRLTSPFYLDFGGVCEWHGDPNRWGVVMRNIHPEDVNPNGCGIVKVQGVNGAIRLEVTRAALPRVLSCRKARAITRFAWNPAHREPGDPTVLAEPPGWRCQVTVPSAPDGGGICERPRNPNAWGILMQNADIHTVYVPRR